MRSLNPIPRPPDEEELLKRIWASPRGLARVTDVNNTAIGMWYVGAALLFLVLAGILALLIRIQLAFPQNDFLDGPTYNQVFTMHGTVMMFLFAVPVVEAMAVYLLPGMLAARDLPFPRLSAFAFWAYFIGGIVFFGSLFFGLSPDGGWFMYPPYTSYAYSPGINQDFWLLGIGFIEISAIAGAIELVVGALRTRAPGMTLDKMPVYAWAMLVVALMIVFGFPPVILVTALLELERAFQWPFFIAEQGGAPLLWQHLFWLFGHPEVYIIFLPAAGLVSMMVPAMAGRPLIGYRLVVLGLVGTGVLSFGLWVHHMFTTGLPKISLGYFSAASLVVTVPSGIQVFAWIATLGAGRPKINAVTLFLLGFLFVFVLGGLTGVMVAIVPFDWQAHDSYFVVAHLHYVLIGGLVFPLMAAFFYWIPVLSGRRLSERVGQIAFWLMFLGFNLAFFPMHISGLMGMPRRVYTYPEGLGWDLPNLLSSIGAFVFAAGVLLVLGETVRCALGYGRKAPDNLWGAGTLEWLPNENYATRSIPLVNSREPLWDDPELGHEVPEGRHFLPGAPTGMRETIMTTTVDARPDYLMILPGPSWSHVLTAVGTAGLFILLTFKLVTPALLFGCLALAALAVWVWSLDLGPVLPEVDIGGGIRLPTYVLGLRSHAAWAVVILMCVSGSIYGSLIFSYFFLWTVSDVGWPPPAMRLADLFWPAIAAGGLIASSLVVWLASALLSRRTGRCAWPVYPLLPIAATLLVGGLSAEGWGQYEAGVRPDQHAYGAVVFTFLGLAAVNVFALVYMALLCLARGIAGRLDAVRRLTFDNMSMLWHYTVAQSLVGLAIVHLGPRLIG